MTYLRLMTLTFVIALSTPTLADWYSEVAYRAPSTTSQDLQYVQRQLSHLLNPLKMELLVDTIDINDNIFGILPGGAPVKILNPQFSIRLITFQTKDNQGTIRTGFIYLLATKQLNIELNSSVEFFNSVRSQESLKFRMSLIESPSQPYFKVELSPDSLHLKTL